MMQACICSVGPGHALSGSCAAGPTCLASGAVHALHKPGSLVVSPCLGCANWYGFGGPASCKPTSTQLLPKAGFLSRY